MKISVNISPPGAVVCLIFLSFISAFNGLSQTPSAPRRYVAISFDDLPVVCRCENDDERHEITDKLLAIFRKFRIPVLGVVNEQKLESGAVPDPSKVALLQKWLDAGHELGNHGYAHRNINDIPMNEYQNEILKGERITRPLAEKAGIPYRFFRHPYLSAGDNLMVRKDLDDFLNKHHYVVAPNTITYQDYTFSGAYESALRNGDTVMAQKIMEAYLPYTLSKWEAAEQQSRDLFGREIKQILMVHANRLNADAFGQVAKMMKERGYVFISIDEALKDPAYARPDTFDGKVGVTWLSRWAAEMGDTNRTQSAQVPEFILDFISIEKR
ncbi:MAG TPA: polysaccharide deacetylase family protein [Chryseosolibacter sp.]|nr:polysaccharide deacetylase family protein [Chryseosolibacter sp.]